MGIETKEGTPNKQPVPIGEDLFALPSSPADKPYLIGSRCKSCGETFFQNRVCCRRCTSEDMERVSLNQTGKLYSFTTIRVKPPHFLGDVPYLMGVVELPEGERIRALLTECDQGSLEIGMDMELVIESVGKTTKPVGKIDVGTEVLGWKFRPRRKEEK